MLRPPQAQVADVAYWVNRELERRGLAGQLACVNTAVEESTLADRAGESMLAQDLFVHEHIEAEDTLVVSVGGNDIALRPTAMTIFHMANLIYGSNEWMIEHGMVTSLLYFQVMMLLRN